MTTQYTTILKLALPVQGELSGTWGDVVNNNITQMVEQAVAGKATVNSWTGNSHTLTSANGTTAESRCAILELTDTGTALSGVGTVICPAASKLYIVDNNTARVITVKTASGSGVAVPVGKTMLVYCDGTNVVEGVTHANSLSLGTSTTTASSILDEDNMASNSATALSTQQSIKAYVDAQVDTADSLSEILAIGNTTGGTDIATTTTDKVQFRDAAIYINSSVDGQLDIVADTEIQIAATTIDINGAINASGEIIAASLDISGNIDVDGITNLDVVDIDGAVDMASTLTLTGNADFNGDLDVDGTIEFDALSGTGSVAVTDIKDEDNMASNSATALSTQQSIKAYVDSQVGTVDTLAEVLANGNTTGSTDIDVDGAQKVQFRDAAIYINSSTDGQLDIVADTEIQIVATTIDINGAVNASGEIIAASLDISGNIDVDGITNLDVVDIDGAVDMATTLAVAGNVDFNGDLDVDGTTNLDVVDIDGAVDMASTLTVAGALTGASLDISGDVDVDGTTNLDVVDIDGAVDMASTLTLAGNADFNGDLDVDGTIEFDALSGTGSVAVTDIKDEDNMASNSATALSTQQSIKAYVDSQVGTADTLAEVLANGNTTGGTDIATTTTDKVQFRDAAIYINSSVDGQLDIVADTEIQIAATTIDINGAVDMATTLAVAGNVDFNGDLDVDGTTNLDVVDIDGAVDMASTLAVAGVLTGASLDISGDIDIDGTANLDIVDIDGAVDMATTLAVAGNVDFNGDLDVDGTTNLDVVDIDGAVDMASTLAVGGVVKTERGSAGAPPYTFKDDLDTGMFNISNADLGFSVGGTERFRIAADGDATITSSTSFSDGLTIKNTADVHGSVISFFNDSSSPADNDYIGGLIFNETNSAGGTHSFAKIFGIALDITDNTEDGAIAFETSAGGASSSEKMRLGSLGSLTVTPAAGGHAVFNEDGIDADFRVESDGNANMLFVDGGNNLVGVGTSNPVSQFAVGGAGRRIEFDGTSGVIRGFDRSASWATLDFEASAYTFDVSTARMMDIAATGVIINEDSADADFRVESNGNANMIRVDGGNNRIGFGFNAPAQSFAVQFTNATRVGTFFDDGVNGAAMYNGAAVLGVSRKSNGSTSLAGPIFEVGRDNSSTATYNVDHSFLTVRSNETVINEDGQDYDFRVESDGNANMLFVDGGNNRVGIGTSSPGHALSLGPTSSYIHLGYNGNNASTEVGRISANSYDVDNASYSLAEMNFMTSSANGYTGEIQFRTNSVNSTNSRAAVRLTIAATGVAAFEAGTSGKYTAVTSSSNAVSLNLQLGDNFSHDLTENTTISFANPAASGKVSTATLRIIQGSTARTITWHSSIKWAGDEAPTLSTGDDDVDVFVFYTVDAGTTYYGFTAGQDMS